MSTRHTSGPWTITEHTEDETSIYGPDGGHPVCSMTTPYVEEDDVENPEFVQEQAVDVMDANARLIAAAPIMLESLKGVYWAYKSIGADMAVSRILDTIRLAEPDFQPVK